MRGQALLRVAALSSLDEYLSGGGLRGVDGQAGSRVRRGVRGGVAGIGDRSRRFSCRCGWRRGIVWAAIATSPCGSDSAGRAPGDDCVASRCWPRGCSVGVLQSHGVGTTVLSPDLEERRQLYPCAGVRRRYPPLGFRRRRRGSQASLLAATGGGLPTFSVRLEAGRGHCDCLA